eukprot:TRINITY_DN49299_c0_g1_i1.p1 TRINITY_DN49299_c0_g1~~TRINITY_DN49299_c0_g1_i1.p1  ORF type:complete len:324 (+),score=36.45 TRINITY_DN49299_c0_g1_i1:67-1038(+)
MVLVNFTTIGAATASLEFREDDLIQFVQEQVGAQLGFPAQRLQLWQGGEALEFYDTVGNCLKDGAMITVVRMPCNVRPEKYEGHIQSDDGCWDTRAVHKLGHVDFPPSQGLNVNMMPFMIEDMSSLPNELQGYWPMIRTCTGAMNQRDGDLTGIFYLTVQESSVATGTSQRRPGLHVDRHAPDNPASNDEDDAYLVSGGEFRWGGTEGGIFMASSVANSTGVWRCCVEQDVIGDLGSLEHLREHLGEGETLDAGELVWITDLTPHESLPLPEGCLRQYFRLVTSEVTHWYSKHSTPNPKGIEPPKSVTIIHEDKFASMPGNCC